MDVGGVGYRAFIPLSTYFKLDDKGKEIELFVSTYLKDDSINLFGFLTEEERLLFERLIKISGIGPRLALNILSGLDPEEFREVLMKGDTKRISVIPGVGKKTAMRLIVELGDKISKEMIKRGEEDINLKEEVLSSLINLGYKRKDVERYVESVMQGDLKEKNFEIILREALKRIAKI
ncbi:MAG: Holliday junction branch migration protein RuvA [Acidobacteriota bacterium]